MQIIKKILQKNKLFPRIKNLFKFLNQLEDTQILLAKVLINQIAQKGTLRNIQESEFKVFSQFGEDGILQYLIRQTCIAQGEKVFIEFGVENYTESNTRFLLVNDNWRGLIIDGSESNIKQCKASDIYWRNDLTAVSAFIDSDNINQIFSKAGFSGEVGILSIDIDGNDFWVWESINVVNPIIVVCEYNSVFGSKAAITVPYDPTFVRTKVHYSNLYFGCSLKALEILAKNKGYALVGCTSAGNNAFFVRLDRLNDIKPLSTQDAYIQSSFRESRDESGMLTYLSGASRLKVIADMPVYDVENKVEVPIKDILTND